MPWEQLRGELQLIIEREPGGNQPVIQNRFRAVNTYEPDFVAVGVGGFDGYVIFAFPDRGLYVLESAHYGSATYVFGEDWEVLSQLTKAAILDGGLQRARLIHREGWDSALRDLFVQLRNRTDASTCGDEAGAYCWRIGAEVSRNTVKLSG
jgi:hypothetical protein